MYDPDCRVHGGGGKPQQCICWLVRRTIVLRTVCAGLRSKSCFMCSPLCTSVCTESGFVCRPLCSSLCS